jgi:glyoxylase-like metal-dependent hydrolase (beta-lactamase superfamily II)
MCAPRDAAPRHAAADLAAQGHRDVEAGAVPRELSAGIWCIPVPVPHGAVASTLVYAIETARGPVLIDAGCDDDSAWNALVSGLRDCGMDVRTTYGVLLTHAHSDHHGLSGRVRRSSGAWIAMHSLDAELLRSTGYMGSIWPRRVAGLLSFCGAPAADMEAAAGLRRAQLVPPDRLLADGDRADVPGRQVTTVWTPGHTPGHVCYRLDDVALLFSGDHVLPTISPRVGVAECAGAPDPLGDMISSLERVAEIEADEVLPGHEFTFGEHRDRCRALLTRHREHLRLVTQVLERGPATPWAIAEGLGRGRPWNTLEPSRRRFILLDVLARLEHLRATGSVSVDASDGVAVFSLMERVAG